MAHLMFRRNALTLVGRAFLINVVVNVLLLVSCTGNTFAADKTLVLTNGNVLRGDVKQLGAFVMVRTASAELRFPHSEVEMVASSLAGIYRKKSAKLPKGSSRPNKQEQLIFWCLQNGLLTEAKQELEDLRRRSPGYATLPLIEKRVQTFQIGMKKTTLPNKSSLHPDTQLAQDRIVRLSKQTTADYVRTVQPLMMNRCAMAGCHGKSTKSEFQLIGSRRSMPVHMTHRNLGATLRQIDGPSQQSLLWMSASSIHGGMKRRMPDDHLKRLYAWIDRVNREIGEHHRVADTAIQQASAELPVDGEDPFDPAKFNGR